MKKFIGPLILLLVAAGFGLFKWLGGESVVQPPAQEPKKQVTVSAFVGGEKMEFLNNPEVRRILRERYGVVLDAAKAGSIEMVTTLPTSGKDALWPSNQIAAEFFRNGGGQILADENIFNSPIVFYSYDIVTDALIDRGIVEKRGPSYYIVDLPKLIQMIEAGESWSDIGLNQLYGKINIQSTDPTRSNSGNIFAGLLANMFNNGTVVTSDTLESVLPKVVHYFRMRGYMERSSSDIFKNFITTGVGAKPIILGYENQLVEFALENEDFIDYLREKIRILYPIPTIWSSHPVIALTSKGKRLIEGLKDDEIQRIAWEQHGFRSGLIGVQNDPGVLKVAGIPKEITAVIPMPDAAVMERIFEALQE